MAETRFRALAEAFNLLKDPIKRQEYQRTAPPASQPISIKPPESASAERSAENWASEAKAALERGEIHQAKALIHYAIRINAQKGEFHAFLATVLEKEGGDVRGVVRALETTVRLNPKDVESHIRLADHFQSLEMQARALRHLQIARGLAPNHKRFRQPKVVQTSKDASTEPKSLKEQWLALIDRFRRKA